jgi:Secretion system C-terminal sorting domain
MYLWMRDFVNEDMSTDLIKASQTLYSESMIKCYPNPANTNSTIVYTGTENTTVSISIYDSFGRLIEEVTDKVRISGKNSITYDTTELMPGIYLVRMRSDQGMADAKMNISR